MKPLPVGEPSFVNIATKGALYVDKTELIYQLANFGGYFFLSRPRRFGKSLLVSTMEELFLGHQELFQETWIYKKWDWKPYPVLKLDFNTIDFSIDRYQLDNILSENFDIASNVFVGSTETTFDRYPALSSTLTSATTVDYALSRSRNGIIENSARVSLST